LSHTSIAKDRQDIQEAWSMVLLRMNTPEDGEVLAWKLSASAGPESERRLESYTFAIEDRFGVSL